VPGNFSVLMYGVYVGSGGGVPLLNGYQGNGNPSYFTQNSNNGSPSNIVYASGGKGASPTAGGVGGNGSINNWPGQPGSSGAVVSGCNGGAGGLGGAGGGPGRTGPGYYNDGGNGGHGGYVTNFPACMAHDDWYLWTDGSKGGNGRVLISW
jgi:hypothetical protein